MEVLMDSKMVVAVLPTAVAAATPVGWVVSGILTVAGFTFLIYNHQNNEKEVKLAKITAEYELAVKEAIARFDIKMKKLEIMDNTLQGLMTAMSVLENEKNPKKLTILYEIVKGFNKLIDEASTAEYDEPSPVKVPKTVSHVPVPNITRETVSMSAQAF